uniref:Glycosyltransferase n=1 Tax=viral metagenome TaxID=1070528 RepID=A0A6C0M3T8_9ZZZZ
MDFTFGIITSNDQYVTAIVHSIRQLHIPNYEIILVGTPSKRTMGDLRVIRLDERAKANWITRKKNLVCQFARYENIVLLHDYVIFHPDWYSGFLKFGSNFDVCVNRILNHDGSRFRDHTLFPRYVKCLNPAFETQCLLPYDFEHTELTSKLAYVSGAFYVVKRHIALRFPLDETKVWGEGEDVEFSYRTSQAGVRIRMNPHSTVSLLKQKDRFAFMNEITDPALLDILRTLTPDDIERWKEDPECFHLFPILHIQK